MDNGTSNAYLENDAADGASVDFSVIQVNCLSTCVSSVASLIWSVWWVGVHACYYIVFSLALKLLEI